MAETAKPSIVVRVACIVVAAIVGFAGAWIALDASQTSGRYWPIHTVSGPIFTLANRAHEMHYAWLTFIGTAVLFAIYAAIATAIRSRMALAVIAVAHAATAVWGIATAAQQS